MPQLELVTSLIDNLFSCILPVKPEYVRVVRDFGIFYMNKVSSDIKYAKRLLPKEYANNFLRSIGYSENVFILTYISTGELSAVNLYDSKGDILYSENSRGDKYKSSVEVGDLIYKNNIGKDVSGNVILSKEILKGEGESMIEVVEVKDVADEKLKRDFENLKKVSSNISNSMGKVNVKEVGNEELDDLEDVVLDDYSDEEECLFDRLGGDLRNKERHNEVLVKKVCAWSAVIAGGLGYLVYRLIKRK